jgi:hypothetical protein
MRQKSRFSEQRSNISHRTEHTRRFISTNPPFISCCCACCHFVIFSQQSTKGSSELALSSLQRSGMLQSNGLHIYLSNAMFAIPHTFLALHVHIQQIYCCKHYHTALQKSQIIYIFTSLNIHQLKKKSFKLVSRRS